VKLNFNGISVETTSNRLMTILDKRPKDVCKITEHKVVQGQAKRVSVKFSTTDFKTIELIHITDVQWGAG
jgi:hypothetical protein